MARNLRTAARVLVLLLIPLAVVSVGPMNEVQNPGLSDYWGSSDDEYGRYLERDLHVCENVDAAHELVRVIASEQLEHAAAACAELRASTGDARERVNANAVERSRTFDELTRRVIDGRAGLTLFAVIVALGALVAALGLGRIAGGLLLVPLAFAYHAELLPLVLAASVPVLALFLACAHYGDEPRTPSDMRAAAIVALVLVPLVSVAMVLFSLNSGSGRVNVRLGVTLALVALGWFTTGIPLVTLIHRARAASPAEPPRMRLARVAVSVLILATAASFAGAIAGG